MVRENVYRKSRAHAVLVEQVNALLGGSGCGDFGCLMEEIESCRSDNEISSMEYGHLLQLLEGYV